MYEYDDGDEGGRSPVRILVTVLVIAALAAAGWFVVKPRLTDTDDDAAPLAPVTSASDDTTGGSSTTEQRGSSTTDEAPASTSSTAPTAAAGDTSTTAASGDSTSTAATTSAQVVTTTTAPPVATTTSPATAPPSTTPATTASSATTAPPTTAPPTTAPPATNAGAVPYTTLPDGSPQPVNATFDVGRTTLDGAVPDQAAVDRLAGLALANSRDPANTTLVNNLTINPAVPQGVGVRVLELTSTRFPEGSAEVMLAHAAELNRVVNVMNVLPKVSVLVIGHADQRGNDLQNFALSEARADAVVLYMASQGVDPSRMSSRAVGEADLLSINDDASSLALNRRTEFVLYGLLIP